MIMKKYFAFLTIPAALLSLAIVLIIPAQTNAQVSCPAGYSCTPITQVPGCPSGYVCTPVNTSPNTCYTFSRNLGVGSAGIDVQQLTYILANQGLLKNGSTDVYDESVAAAVTSFQEKYASDVLVPSGLSNGTGYVGKATRTKLNKLCGIASTNNTNNTSDIIRIPTAAPSSNQPVNPISVINATTKPSITFPITSSVLQAGQSYNITWTNENSDSNNYSVYLDQSLVNGQAAIYLGSVSASQQTFVFKVPSNVQSGSQYRILMQLPNTNTISSSVQFTITAQNQTGTTGGGTGGTSGTGGTTNNGPVSATISTDPATPPVSSTPVPTGGQLRGLSLLTFDVNAQSGDVAIKSLTIHIDTNAVCCVNQAFLYSGNTLLSSALLDYPTGANGYTFGNHPSSVNLVNGVMQYNYSPIFTIPQGTTQPLTIKIDANNIGSMGMTAVVTVGASDISLVSGTGNISGSATSNAITITNH